MLTCLPNSLRLKHIYKIEKHHWGYKKNEPNWYICKLQTNNHRFIYEKIHMYAYLVGFKKALLIKERAAEFHQWVNSPSHGLRK